MTNGHAHRWRLETPSGPVTHGVCAGCGAERDFSSFGPEGLWTGSDLDLGRKPWHERQDLVYGRRGGTTR